MRAATALQPPGLVPDRALVLAAHPDDETLGAGAVLALRPGCQVLHLTDGAPADPRLWSQAFQGTREGYAALRQIELRRALERAGVGPERVRSLGARDQEAPLQLAPLTRALVAELRRLRPPALLAQPYEGGHPDHDAAAFIARAAVALLGRDPPLLLEMTSYHRRDGQLRTGEFLQPAEVETLVLDASLRATKRAMLDAFASQRPVLEPFGVEVERFRRAPGYDFTRPPHDGILHYEALGWPMRGARFCELARAALRELGLEAQPWR